jgi:HD superfamily phosphodiesterase
MINIKIMSKVLLTSYKHLISIAPRTLKELLFRQWEAKQNIVWHPEGNTLKHIIVVLRRAYKKYPNNPNIIMAALFHDLGKMDTYGINEKTGQPTAYGHEHKSAEYVLEYKDWILSFEGTDIEAIHFIVKNHMLVKYPNPVLESMRLSKRVAIENHRSFNDLIFFSTIDKGGIV